MKVPGVVVGAVVVVGVGVVVTVVVPSTIRLLSPSYAL